MIRNTIAHQNRQHWAGRLVVDPCQMRIRSFVFAAVATLTCLAMSPAVFAQDAADEDVSEQVDLTLWCGAYYGIIEQVAKDDPAKQALAKNYSGQAYTQGAQALADDGIEETEYERIITDYVNMAVAEVQSAEDDNRYTDDECFALITP